MDDDAEGPREVVVPERVYKAVTVFSTLFAVVGVVGGFIIIDRATQRATAPAAEVDLPLAALGLLAILAGSAVYAFSTRFRTAGMGKSKDESADTTDNG